MGDMNLLKRFFPIYINVSGFQRFSLSFCLSLSLLFDLALLDCIRADFDCSKLVYIIFFYTAILCVFRLLTPLCRIHEVKREKNDREKIANKHMNPHTHTLVELGNELQNLKSINKLVELENNVRRRGETRDEQKGKAGKAGAIHANRFGHAMKTNLKCTRSPSSPASMSA